MAPVHPPPGAEPCFEKRLKKINNELKSIRVKYDQADFVKSDVLELKVPSVSKLNEERFSGNGEFLFVNRKGLMSKLVKIYRDWEFDGFKGRHRSVVGFRRSGKSYALAALVCFLRKTIRKKVVYIHNCADFKNRPIEYLRREVAAAFYAPDDEGAETTQMWLLQCDKEQLLQFLQDRNPIVIADQVGALYNDGSPGASEALSILKGLSDHTLVIRAASARSKPEFLSCLADADKKSLVHVFEGFTSDEFEAFRKHVDAYRNMDDTDIRQVEFLTGFLPGLLTIPHNPSFQAIPKKSASDSTNPTTAASPQTNTEDVERVENFLASLHAYAPIEERPSKKTRLSFDIEPLLLGMKQWTTESLRDFDEIPSGAYEAAVFEAGYHGSLRDVNFDVVSLPLENSVHCTGAVHCPSEYIRQRIKDKLEEKHDSFRKMHLLELEESLKGALETQEPTKVGDAMEDYLLGFIKEYKVLPMSITGLEKLNEEGIRLDNFRVFEGRCPKFSLRTDLEIMQKNSGTSRFCAWAYFPMGKFLPFIDFVVRLYVHPAKTLFIIAAQVTMSEPKDHKESWEFYSKEGDYKHWEEGSDDLQVKHVLAWLTPHSYVSLYDFQFKHLEHIGSNGLTQNVSFDMMSRMDERLKPVLGPLSNFRRFKPCGCKTFCPRNCGCRKARIPCRPECKCEAGHRCANSFSWAAAPPGVAYPSAAAAGTSH